ncbi:carbohydrate ABC transporter permease [Paenibacillus pasadenensis]|uniref:carbohydrate ABC transporter permease n=1 Tax=Paenibacillus pasadenensis TaxID=217090 RepID=UPI00203F5093|nr:carbohydrate ABC transporter permease [Paenibacillus pasadenensis]MCM3749742.1 carbohydrate ABC transporter permease [Paenibacillus pasadenensis]
MRLTRGEKWFNLLNYVLLSAASLTCLLPLVNIGAVSLSSNEAILSGKVFLLPVELNVQAYSILFKGTPVLNAFGNSLILTAVGTAVSMLLTFLAAYPLSRPDFYNRRFFTLAIVFTMIFSSGVIPQYLLVKSLGLINSYWAIWLPAAISAYNMLIMKNHFENLPVELEEAARIDGASELRFIGKIVLPLSIPMLATLSLFYGVAMWNNFMSVLIYINDANKLNLSVLVQQMVRSQSLAQDFALRPEDIAQSTPEGVKSAGVMVMIIPLLLVYPFIQKYFVKGAMIGAIKG